ncbi:hypothetical protein [Corynebacterium glyciniphilum]|uniref:hypothetical protein n=1 Tax=Corynebacterium glyciniphilum TaxID=1404244 RepID=UPI00264E4F6F|nr:hypothetical protein [Corynebacterium glyciniphilum]MDN5684955.1 hypothetical protein [Corynebacterium glyciniphilum]MDN6706593.1 hypothetical protein [Corynebacterium glyciniphilum]
MAIVNASPNGSVAVLAADTDLLRTVVTRLGDIADRLSSTVPGEPTVLLAGVPQAARLAEALHQARERQVGRLADFASFYRAGATSLTSVADGLNDAEDAATTSFGTLHTGRLA